MSEKNKEKDKEKEEESEKSKSKKREANIEVRGLFGRVNLLPKYFKTSSNVETALDDIELILSKLSYNDRRAVLDIIYKAVKVVVRNKEL